jgi:RNA polymerase sigma-70 factor, ECF subfamily
MNRISVLTLTSDELGHLLLRMSARDEAAFGRLYAATWRKLFATVLVLVKHRYLAEEVLQEAYVRIWLNAGSYRTTLGTPMVWMITIARNLAIDVARKSAREVHADDAVLADIVDQSPSAVETIENREAQHDAIKHQHSVFTALHALDPAKRHLVIAAYLYGESRDRLSKHYGVPVNTIKTWLRRALLEVRASLQNGSASVATPMATSGESSVINA